MTVAGLINLLIEARAGLYLSQPPAGQRFVWLCQPSLARAAEEKLGSEKPVAAEGKAFRYFCLGKFRYISLWIFAPRFSIIT